MKQQKDSHLFSDYVDDLTMKFHCRVIIGH